VVVGVTRRALIARVVGLGGLGSAAQLFAACRSWPRQSQPGARLATRTAIPSPTTIVLGLPSEPTFDDLPLVHLSRQDELLRQQDLQLRLVRAPVGEALSALVAGRVQFALLDVPTVAVAVEQKLDLLGIFQLYASDSSVVFSLARRGLESAASLKGRRVGLRQPQGAALRALAASLRTADLGLQAVQLVIESSRLGVLLESGRASALAVSRHILPWFEARSLQVAHLPRGGWEQVPGPSIVTTRSFAEENRADARKLVAALSSGLVTALADAASLRETAGSIFLVEPGERQVLDAQTESVLYSVQEGWGNQVPGWADRRRYEAVQHYLQDQAVTDGRADLTRVFVNDYLPQA
jgi:ABC-type nitrate/sulfonate/bicarbonate transport system substrate-binding protein